MDLIGYIRVSTDEQGNSVADQRPMLERYCGLYGHTLVDVIVDEDVSGGKDLDKRPGGAELMRRLEAGEADGFVITEIDRAFRLAVDGLRVADWFEKRDLQIHTVFDQVNTANPDGWMMFAMRVVSADWERRKIGYRTKRALGGLRQRGRAYSGNAPYGTCEVLSQDGGEPVKLLYRDPDTWPVRERIVALAEAKGVRQIAEQLNAERVPAPGGRGKGGREVGGKRWHASTISRIVKTHSEIKHIPPMRALPETVISLGAIR